MNSCLTIEFIGKHSDDLNWSYLSANSCLTIEFIEKYINQMDWKWLSGNPNLTIEFIEKHMNDIEFEYLSTNEFNFNEFVYQKNLRIYSESLKREIPVMFFEFEKHHNRKESYEPCLDMLRMRIRDLGCGLRRDFY
jgi:hypothetical protein